MSETKASRLGSATPLRFALVATIINAAVYGAIRPNDIALGVSSLLFLLLVYFAYLIFSIVSVRIQKRIRGGIFRIALCFLIAIGVYLGYLVSGVVLAFMLKIVETLVLDAGTSEKFLLLQRHNNPLLFLMAIGAAQFALILWKTLFPKKVLRSSE
jgi:hypothetical protein